MSSTSSKESSLSTGLRTKYMTILSHLRSKLLEFSTVLISCVALAISIVSFYRGTEQHSDVLTSTMIREAYNRVKSTLDYIETRTGLLPFLN